ncbi:hypothetical protein A4X06_0g3047 [Tilletia controversa]|uniref:Zn(2)-C6 fungal-type domain-containing protein n=1 Tax=Tilletia controversa TaxID=13291 RepID=A0A8X7MVG7_9BASI|nr:hypothetical protein CF328_g2637 [Tilletia controversa]KAE8249829.1 hypothetical protein A4X06_0g3047 [Tilletia controversa]
MRSDPSFHQQPWKLFSQHPALSFNNTVASTLAPNSYRSSGRELGHCDASVHHTSQNGGSFGPSYQASPSSFQQSNHASLWGQPVPFSLGQGPTSADPPHRLLQTNDEIPMLIPSTTAQTNAQHSSMASHSYSLNFNGGGGAYLSGLEQMAEDSENEGSTTRDTIEIAAKKRSSKSSAAGKKRNTKACDGCRRQKCKCEPDPQNKSSCAQCALLGQSCTYNDESKKRGPPKGYIEAIETRLHHMENVLYELMCTQDPDGKSVLERLVGEKVMGDICSGKIQLKRQHDPERRGTTRPGQGGKWKHSWWAAPLENRIEEAGKASVSCSAQECMSPSSSATTSSSPKDQGTSIYAGNIQGAPASLNPSRPLVWESCRAEDNQDQYPGSPKSATQPSESNAAQEGTHDVHQPADPSEGVISAMDIRHIEAWSNPTSEAVVPEDSTASMTAGVNSQVTSEALSTTPRQTAEFTGSAPTSALNPLLDQRNALSMNGAYFNQPCDGSSSQFGAISSSPANSNFSMSSTFLPTGNQASPTNGSVHTSRSPHSSDNQGILSSPWNFGNVQTMSSSPYGTAAGVVAARSDSSAWVSPGMKLQEAGYIATPGMKRKRNSSNDCSSMLPPDLPGAPSNLYTGSPCPVSKILRGDGTVAALGRSKMLEALQAHQQAARQAQEAQDWQGTTRDGSSSSFNFTAASFAVEGHGTEGHHRQTPTARASETGSRPA